MKKSRKTELQNEEEKQKDNLDSYLRKAHETLEISRSVERKLYDQGKTIKKIDEDCSDIGENLKKADKIVSKNKGVGEKLKSFFSFGWLKSKEKPLPRRIYMMATRKNQNCQRR